MEQIYIFLMKNLQDKFIEARVHKFGNISEKIKEFIQQKSIQNYTPFYQQQPSTTPNKNHYRAKRSLTDWRQLFQRSSKIDSNTNKHSVLVSEGQKMRCSMTGQCNRSKRHYMKTKAYSFVGDRFTQTHQSKRSKYSQTKKQSLIEFAIAQNCYESDVFKDERAQTSKEKQFYEKRESNNHRREYEKVGEYLSNIKLYETGSKQMDITQKYMDNLKQFDKNTRLLPYNLAKIQNKNKIDNSRFIVQRRINLSSENGLRFYSRA